MRIIHRKSILVMNIGVHSVIGYSASASVVLNGVCLSVMDSVFRIQQVSSWKTKLFARSLSFRDV